MEYYQEHDEMNKMLTMEAGQVPGTPAGSVKGETLEEKTLLQSPDNPEQAADGSHLGSSEGPEEDTVTENLLVRQDWSKKEVPEGWN